MICALNFPACNPITGRVLPICEDQCILVDEIIRQCSTEFFRHNPEFPTVNRFLNTFVCDRPETYYNFPLQYIETTNPNDCSLIGWCIHACMYIYMLCIRILTYVLLKNYFNGHKKLALLWYYFNINV